MKIASPGMRLLEPANKSKLERADVPLAKTLEAGLNDQEFKNSKLR